MPFVKLDTGILDSSLWSEASSTRICWITLLAMADSTGLVRATTPGIANRANLGVDETRKALEIFESPDENSRSTNDNGRKIRRVDGGYEIINYLKYREIDYTAADRMRRYRLRRNERNGSNKTVTLRKQKQSTEAESRSRPKDQKEVEDFCVSVGLQKTDGQAMWLDWQERGYGKTKDWQAKIRKWKICGYHPSQKQKRNGAHPDTPKPVDRSKIDLPERFKSWASDKYPDRREHIMSWKTWANVPNSLRQEWWTSEKEKLPIGDLI